MIFSYSGLVDHKSHSNFHLPHFLAQNTTRSDHCIIYPIFIIYSSPANTPLHNIPILLTTFSTCITHSFPTPSQLFSSLILLAISPNPSTYTPISLPHFDFQYSSYSSPSILILNLRNSTVLESTCPTTQDHKG